MHTKHKGSQSELVACAWLLQRGYEVFRNVSAHGPVDIIGLKDGVAYRFDVKTTDGTEPALTAEQQALDVRAIVVTDDGKCRIVDDQRYSEPKPAKETTLQEDVERFWRENAKWKNSAAYRNKRHGLPRMPHKLRLLLEAIERRRAKEAVTDMKEAA
jgi:hypothetical protein